MRKLGMAGVLAAAALFAQGVRAESAGEKAKAAGTEASGAARTEGQRAKEAADRAVNGAGSADENNSAREARSPMNDGAHGRTAQNAEKKHSMFDGKSNFDVDGKIQSVSGDKITIARDDLPPATLHVSAGTKIELDGDKVSAKQLRQGEDVKASFNLNKDKAEAVEIKAKRNK